MYAIPGMNVTRNEVLTRLDTIVFSVLAALDTKSQKPMQQLKIRFRYECHERTVVLKLSVTKRRNVFVTNKKVLTNELRALNVHIKTCRALKLSRGLFFVL